MVTRQGREHRGFTLVELLVAVAILSVIMSGIVAVFAGSMRAVRQGYQSMDAFEVARTAMDIVERDLTTCFTSREHGDYYTFFGCPAGFTFVGVTQTTDGTGRDLNLARVSYVVHYHDTLTPYGATVGGRTFDAEVEDPLNPGVWIMVRVRTRSLLRFVEPNRSDLDSFPFPWPDAFAPAPAVDPASPMMRVYEELRGMVAPGGVDLRNQAPAGSPEDVLLEEVMMARLQAKKRELWLRMLAGDATLPDVWAEMGQNPADYVLAEDLFWVAEELGGARLFMYTDAGVFALGGLPDDDYFAYGRTARRELADGTPLGLFSDTGRYFNSGWNVPGNGALGDYTTPPSISDFQDAQWAQVTLQYEALGNPQTPRLPEFLQMRFWLALPSAYPGAPDFRRLFETTIEIPAGLVRTVPRELRIQ